MFGGINNIYMGGYKFSAHCTNISAHKIYFRASLFICGEYFLDRTAIRTVMNENHDPLIHKFPPEIASHIFIHYSPPSTFFNELDTNNPLFLGAVCQKWRQLAWATPELWTSLSIIPNAKYNFIEHPPLVKQWLERSASLPLTIRLEDHWGWVDDDDKMINILNKHSAR